MPYTVAILQTDRVTGTPPQVTAVRELLVQHFDREPEVAAQEFVPAGSPDGQLPASVWWLATLFAEDKLALAQQIALQFPGSRVEPYDQDTEPLRPWAVLAEMGVQPLQLDVP
jgi:hypothetical protein